ncbi:MAG: response regulator [Candidatus Zixiibacteriota bacterium]
MSEPHKKKTILIADDDENVRVMCERELREEGYITHTVSSGLEALQFIKRNPQIDLVVLDLKMPSLNGIQVLKQLRGKKVKVPVILYSDYSAYRNDFSAGLADAHVVKSSDLTELKEKVKELLSFEKE